MNMIAQCDETREVTHAEQKTIAFTVNSDLRYFSLVPDAPYRVRRAFPDELLPYTTDARYVLVVMKPGLGLARFPLSEEEAAAARDALTAITAVLIRAGVR